jgi:hypothetical protein
MRRRAKFGRGRFEDSGVLSRLFRRCCEVSATRGLVHAWKGAQITLICFDELTHFSAHQFFYMVSRNRSTCGVRPYIRATCNPDADSWVADFLSWWIDPESGHPIRERAGVLRYFSMEWFEAQKKNG